MQGNDQKARSLFYRSIRECPWSKGKFGQLYWMGCWADAGWLELYMLGIKSFGANMDEKEANELINLMMEKEIRLRIPIDDEMLT